MLHAYEYTLLEINCLVDFVFVLFDFYRFMIGREKDSENSEVAQLISQSLQHDKAMRETTPVQSPSESMVWPYNYNSYSPSSLFRRANGFVSILSHVA